MSTAAEFTPGQPIVNRRSGAVSWVEIVGDDYVVIRTQTNHVLRVDPANYGHPGPDVPWSTMPQANYGVARGGWSN